jgi:hypothetical protein
MVTVITDGDTIRAVDPANNTVELTVAGWDPSPDDRLVPDRTVGISQREVDETVTGHASEIEFGTRDIVKVERPDGAVIHNIREEGETLDLDGEYVVKLLLPLRTTVHFDATARLEKPDEVGGEISLSFDDRPVVTIGFADDVDLPEHTVTVPRTPSGAATAISTFGATHSDLSTHLAQPGARGYPPRVEFGESADVPPALRSPPVTPDVETVVEVPPRVDTLFPVASLAYYLAATVRTAEGPPRVTVPEVDFEHRLSAPPGLADSVAALLRRTVYLDAVVHSTSPRRDVDIVEADVLDELELDPTAVREAAPGRRLAEYVGLDFSAVSDRFPEWPFSAYVAPEIEYLEALPHLVRSLANLYPPEADSLQQQQLLSRAQATTYREGNTGDVPTVERVDPNLQSAEAHGWLAGGKPIDVFKPLPAAYRNRRAHLSSAGDTVSVTLVLNDEEMVEEHQAATEIYRERVVDGSDGMAMDLTVEEQLSTAELARVLEADSDFVHYIGHCEEDGLRCSGGRLSTSTLSGCGAQTFFLNACGSYYEAVELVRQGAIAGGATFRAVTNRHAAQIGTAFARLMMHGFSIWRALDLARRQAMSGADYLVVGDGLYRLTQTKEPTPILFEVAALGDDYRLSGRYLPETSGPGGFCRLYLGSVDRGRLFGATFETRLDRQELVSYLTRGEAPVVIDGEFHWSSEIESILD